MRPALALGHRHELVIDTPATLHWRLGGREDDEH